MAAAGLRSRGGKCRPSLADSRRAEARFLRLKGGQQSEGVLPSPNSLSTASTPPAPSEKCIPVSGTKCHLCLGPLTSPPRARRQGRRMRFGRRAAAFCHCSSCFLRASRVVERSESFFRQLGFAAKPANESHRRPLNGLGDRLSVAEVILVALEVRFTYCARSGSDRVPSVAIDARSSRRSVVIEASWISLCYVESIPGGRTDRLLSLGFCRIVTSEVPVGRPRGQ